MTIDAARTLRRVRFSCLPLFFSILLMFVLLISSYPAQALEQARTFALSTSTVREPSVTFAVGNNGSNSVSSTGDYANVTTTAGLTFNETANVLVPTQAMTPAIDSSVSASFSSQTSGSSPSLAVGSANEVIYVAVSILGTNTVSSISNNGTALGWAQRANANNTGSPNVRVETWYAFSSVSHLIITVQFASSTTFGIIAFSIKNANVPNCFDGLVSAAPHCTGSGQSQTVSASTMLCNVLLIGSIAVSSMGGPPTPSAGNGFTLIQGNNQDQLGFAAENQSLNASASSASISFSDNSEVVWALIGDAIWGKLPTLSIDTDFTSPTITGNQVIDEAQEGYLVSPAYPTATTVYSGSWQLNLWASSSTANDTMNVDFLVVDSSYNIISVVVAKGSTGSIPSTESLVTATYSAPQFVVPSGGHLVVILTNVQGSSSSFTVYWGNGQTTNFRTPQVFDYVLLIVNSAATSFSVSFSTYSNSSISRLMNFTMYVYSPSSTCIVITNGAFTQSSSSVLSLPGSSTFYVAVYATASDFNNVSNMVFRLKFAPTTKPFAIDSINMTVN